MDAIASLLALDLRSVVIASVAIVALVVFVPYFKDPARLRSYPGPLLAKFSSLYLARLAYKGIVGTSVCGAHEKYGMHLLVYVREHAADSRHKCRDICSSSAEPHFRRAPRRPA